MSENIKTKATMHGKINEKKALMAYKKLLKGKHVNLNVEDAGLHVNSKYIFLGASPDGVITCDCHEPGLVEIKCPYKYRNGLSQGWYTDKNSPINQTKCIKQSHSYFFQMQHQMLVTNKNYVDFFVWSAGKNVKDNFLIRVDN